MTDPEKLQQLFQAALKAPPTEGKATLARAFPTPAPLTAAPVSEAVPAPEPPATVAASSTPVANAGLDDAASAELGALLDEQMARQKRRRKRELIGTLIVVFGLTGGGLGWFVQSPTRIQAFREAMADIRSVGDVAAMVAKYQVALDKIATRSNQINQATEAMGGSADQDGMKDVNMDAEMHAMMGGEGKTTGERNKMLQNALGKKFKAPASAIKPTSDQAAAKKASADSFEFN
jgi:uncharacterized protein YggU (UPF0235/DUF167 family)